MVEMENFVFFFVPSLVLPAAQIKAPPALNERR